MICAVSWRERTACCGTGCSRPGSARNGLQVRVSIGTQCSHQQRQRYSYSTAGTLCYFVAAFQDLPPSFYTKRPPTTPLHVTLALSLLLPQCVSASLALRCHFQVHVATLPARLSSPEGKGLKTGGKERSGVHSERVGRTFSTRAMRWGGRAWIRRNRRPTGNTAGSPAVSGKALKKRRRRRKKKGSARKCEFKINK